MEISVFEDWLNWAYSDNHEEALRWWTQNQDAWALLMISRIYGEERALEIFKMYTKAPTTERTKFYSHLLTQFLKILDLLRKAWEVEAEQGKNTGESEGNGKNPEMMSIGVRDTEDRGQGEGNGKTIEC